MTDSAKPTDHHAGELDHPDGTRTLVWSRRGRIRIAVIGSALAIAAGGVAVPSSDNPPGGSGDQAAQTADSGSAES